MVPLPLTTGPASWIGLAGLYCDVTLEYTRTMVLRGRLTYSIYPLIVGAAFLFLMLVSPPDGGLIRPKRNHLNGALIVRPLPLNPVIPTRWPIKDIDCGGGGGGGVFTSGFIYPETPSDIGCVQEGTAYGGDVGYRLENLHKVHRYKKQRLTFGLC